MFRAISNFLSGIFPKPHEEPISEYAINVRDLPDNPVQISLYLVSRMQHLATAENGNEKDAHHVLIIDYMGGSQTKEENPNGIIRGAAIHLYADTSGGPDHGSVDVSMQSKITWSNSRSYRTKRIGTFGEDNFRVVQNFNGQSLLAENKSARLLAVRQFLLGLASVGVDALFALQQRENIEVWSAAVNCHTFLKELITTLGFVYPEGEFASPAGYIPHVLQDFFHFQWAVNARETGNTSSAAMANKQIDHF